MTDTFKSKFGGIPVDNAQPYTSKFAATGRTAAPEAAPAKKEQPASTGLSRIVDTVDKLTGLADSRKTSREFDERQQARIADFVKTGKLKMPSGKEVLEGPAGGLATPAGGLHAASAVAQAAKSAAPELTKSLSDRAIEMIVDHAVGKATGLPIGAANKVLKLLGRDSLQTMIKDALKGGEPTKPAAPGPSAGPSVTQSANVDPRQMNFNEALRNSGLGQM